MSLATRIIAVRHGETSWNQDGRIQGHTDIDLNDTGRWQAACAGRALAEEAIDAIYSSDLQRALHTAQAIGAHHSQAGVSPLQVRQHLGLRERNFGIFEGHTYDSIDAQWPEAARRWKAREPSFAPDGGESPLDVLQRVEKTVAELAAGHLGQQIVLVAHGGVMDMLYRLATRQSVDAARTWTLHNTAINRLLWTPQALTLVGWADLRHLDQPPLEEPAG